MPQLSAMPPSMAGKLRHTSRAMAARAPGRRRRRRHRCLHRDAIPSRPCKTAQAVRTDNPHAERCSRFDQAAGRASHAALKVTDFQMLLEFQTSAQICVLFWRCINLALYVLHVAARGFENIVISNFHILFFRFVFWKIRGTGETQHALAS